MSEHATRRPSPRPSSQPLEAKRGTRVGERETGRGSPGTLRTAPALGEFRLTAILHTLRACQLFAGLAPEDLRSVAAISRLRPLARGDYLFREGEPCRGFYIVQQGTINVHRVSAAGKEQVIHVFRAGESFAEAALATDAGYPADARAIESSQVLFVQRAEFITLLRRHPELALRMLASLSLHLRALVGRLDDLTLKDVETRLAHWFIRRCPDPEATSPVTIELPMAKQVLAAELGTVSETLSRTLGRFREQGLIAVQRRTVTVLSPARLRAVLRQLLGGELGAGVRPRRPGPRSVWRGAPQ